MDISQENVEADSLSCPESDSLLLPSSVASSTRPPIDVDDLPRDADDAASSTAPSRPEMTVDKELESLTIDVVEAWRIVAPPLPEMAPIKVDHVKYDHPKDGAGGQKSEVMSPASESGAFEVYRSEG